jgi:hypothetical protein
VIGSVEVLEQSSASALTYGAISAKTLVLEAGSSKTASMTRSQPCEVGGVGGRGDPAEQLVLLLLGELAAGDRLVEQLLASRPCPSRRLERDVLEHDLDAGAAQE